MYEIQVLILTKIYYFYFHLWTENTPNNDTGLSGKIFKIYDFLIVIPKIGKESSYTLNYQQLQQ